MPLSDGTNGSGIDPDTIELVVDSTRVAHTFDPLTGKLSYTPQYKYADGSHNVSVRVKDQADNLGAPTKARPIGMAQASAGGGCRRTDERS